MTGTVKGLISANCFFNCSSFFLAASASLVSAADDFSSSLISASSAAFCFSCSGVNRERTGLSSFLSASSVLLKSAKNRKYSSCVIGSYLWLWHWAQAIVVPIQTASVVLTRSTTATLRNSSSLVPPSLFVSVLR